MLKKTSIDLSTQIFARRRYHEVENRRNDTIERRQKSERTKKIVMCSMAIVFTPILIAPFVYMHQNYAPREPLPWWFVFVFMPITLFSICPCTFLIFTSLTPRPGFGRWIIAFDGIFYRYGKSPHRFVPFSSLKSVRVEQPKSSYAVIVLETGGDPLRIPERIFDGHARNGTDLLPFLNVLIDHLQRGGWHETNLTPLLTLQRHYQGSRLPDFWFMNNLMIACYFLPVFGVLPFYPYICTFPYPAVLWACAFCCVVVVLIGFMLNARLERWKDKKVAEKLDSIKWEYNGAACCPTIP